MNTKMCKDCSKEKTLDEFSKNKNMKDGHINQCKECESITKAIYHQEHKEIHLANMKKRRDNFTEQEKEAEQNRLAAWRANNPDKIKEARRKANARYYGTEKDVARRDRRQERKQSTKQGIISLCFIRA